MYIIGENIQVLSTRVREAIENRDAETIIKMAKEQWDAGAQAIDLNIGRQKKHGTEIMPWIVEVVQEALPEATLSLDTTNPAALEAGLKVCKNQPFINSASAEQERLDAIMPLAAKYNAKLIALTMVKEGIPVEAERRLNIALEIIVPKAMELGVPVENLYIDPLVLTVSGTQEYVPNAVETVRMLKMVMDPPPMTVVGLSNVSNQVAHEKRGLINRTYLVMLLAVGLDSAIADPLDKEQMEFVRIVEERDDNTGAGKLLLNLYDTIAAMEEPSPDMVDMNDPEQVAIWKTVQILQNKIIFAENYLAT